MQTKVAAFFLISQLASAAPLHLTKIRDLDFSTAIPGSAAKTVVASDYPGAAEFSVSGEPNQVVTVTVPTENVVISTNGGGSANTEIDVGAFKSSAVEIVLNGSGYGSFSIGATRAAISYSQNSGSYVGWMTVTVTNSDRVKATESIAVMQTVISGMTLTATREGFLKTLKGKSFRVSPKSPGAAMMELTGEPNQTFTIALPQSITLTHNGGKRKIILGMKSSFGGNGILDSEGKASIGLGFFARGSVPTLRGEYSGTFTIAVADERAQISALGAIHVILK